MSVMLKNFKMPNSCVECPLQVTVSKPNKRSSGVLCVAMHKRIPPRYLDPDNEKYDYPDWCPLEETLDYGERQRWEKMSEYPEMGF